MLVHAPGSGEGESDLNRLWLGEMTVTGKVDSQERSQMRRSNPVHIDEWSYDHSKITHNIISNKRLVTSEAIL